MKTKDILKVVHDQLDFNCEKLLLDDAGLKLTIICRKATPWRGLKT